MIEIWSYRENGGPEILLSSRYAELGDAVESLCKFEMGYGGTVTDLTEERLETMTHILHCKDRTVFMGPKEEMKDLLTALYLWLRAEKEVSFEAWYKKVFEVTNGVPLLVTISAGILKGELVKEKLREQLGAA